MIEDPTSNITDPIIEKIETAFLVLYTIEMGLKIFGTGFILHKNSYIRDGWNVLDFIIGNYFIL